MYIVQSKVRRLAKEHGKRVSRAYLQYLERRVHDIVIHHIGIMGGRVTLNIDDAEALDAYRAHR